MEFSTWLALFAASWAISISPGAGAIAAMNAGISHGFRLGYWMTAGLILGIMTQIVLVGVGLGAVVATSGLAFEIVKWLGVAYLIWLGIAQWRAPLQAVALERTGMRTTRPSKLILKGWMINAVNPKGTVFLLAIVPQFLDLAQPLASQYLVIAVTLAFTDAVVMAGYTALASRLLHLLRKPSHVKLLNRSFGSLFFLAGLSLSLFRRT
ncbi:LysE family transporter [Orrella marina]|uniref:Threonine transporter RhtB n=1 Tax=Orrella marina TaxID=2163011 RepID=A0A2R4XGD2_9BURK|nr:LysE family transporter [Orrella marina]AWB32851.1 threonine transporter RhtB [Orrella marina]